MTNEEKAKEISQLWWRECGWQLQAAAYDAAIEAMAWKDEQHAKEKQQRIDKACKFWEHKFPYLDIDTIKEFVDIMK